MNTHYATTQRLDAVIFPEGYLNENVEQACHLAKFHKTILIGGHRKLHERPKDRAILIDRLGKIVLDRVKYSSTTFVVQDSLKIGHILCDELVIQGIKNDQEFDIDIVIHPIGVGMFSKEQFDEWVTEARKIAIKHKTMIIGTSHADGSYRDTGVSIPISYCIDKEGQTIFVAENDVRPRVIDIKTKEFLIIG